MANSKTNYEEGVKLNYHHGISNIKSQQLLPPIGVFWDIENCQVPKGKSALATAQLIRKRFFEDHREAEFMCVCDISKESKEVIQELNNAQVTVVHINATGKNAADDKLRQSMRRFADIHGSPSTIVLISGDVNFAADLSDFNHRRHIHIIVLHNNFAPEPLLACAHKHFNFAQLLNELPFRTPVKSNGQQYQSCELLVTKLPMDHSTNQIRSRLKQLSDNCGGRVTSVSQCTAIIRFPTPEAAQRAKRRMAKEDVYGSKISVNFPSKHELVDSTDNPLLNSPAKRLNINTEENGKTQSFSKPHFTKLGGGNVSISPIKYGKGGDFPPPPTITPLGNICNSSWLDLNIQRQALNPEHPSTLNSRSKYFEFVQPKEPTKSVWPQHGLLPIDRTYLNCSPSLSPLNFTPLIKEPSEGYNGIDQSQRQQQENVRSHLKAPRQSRRRVKSGSFDRNTNYSPFSGLVSPAFNRQQADQAVSQSASRAIPGRSISRSISPLINDQASNTGQTVNEPVDLIIGNLDQSVEINDLKKEIRSLFQSCVKILQLTLTHGSDGNITALVKVNNLQEAQFAISKLHRQKIGYRRIAMSIASNNGSALPILKSQVQMLLQDVPGNSLPLFKFRELFEKRYHQSITSQDFLKMKDLVIIQENSNGRFVMLNRDYRDVPSPACSEGSKEVQSIMEKSFCEIHCPNPNDGKGWAEKEGSKSLPDVGISLKDFGPRLLALLISHNGSLPLGSFLACYKHEFGPITAVKEGGVSLEHLIACVPDMGIITSANGSKRVKLFENKVDEPPSEFRTISPPLAPQLALFSREIVDLLKNFDNCLIPFVKFIPAYHHHFGRQCRVADYGYTKLIDLLDAIGNIVQVIGEGNKRMITLTHRSQIKRFTSDVLRILKSQASKQLLLKDFASLYLKCFNKEFKITNYGVCELMDLLDELPEHTIIVTSTDNDVMISIPRRDQTQREIERTKQFSLQVLELLRQSPQCRMSFHKFIPSYHHHFSQQCRVADYGFTKLHELFEAISDIVKIYGEGDEKMLILEEQELLRVFVDQITSLIKSSMDMAIPIHRLMKIYMQNFGHSINLDDFQVADELELLSKIRHAVQIADTSNGLIVKLAEPSTVRQMCFNIRRVLMEHPGGEMTATEFNELYLQRFSQTCNVVQLADELDEFIHFEGRDSNAKVTLRPLQLFARNVHILLHEHNGRIDFIKFNELYFVRFNVACSPNQFGFQNLVELVQAIPEIAHLRGKGNKKIIQLNREFLAGSPLHTLSTKNQNSDEKVQNTPQVDVPMREDAPVVIVDSTKTPPLDLLSAPVPSCVPSPSIQPNQVDLITFDSPIKENTEKPRAVTQDTLATALHQALDLSTKNVRGVGHHVSARGSTTSPIRIMSEVLQPLSPSQQDICTPNGNTNHLNYGNLPVENTACKSCENLTLSNECYSASEVYNSSSQSTPTHQSQSKTRLRSRIAANFSQKVGL